MTLGRQDGYVEITGEQSCQKLFTDKEELYITGYNKNAVRRLIFYCVNIVLSGFPMLVMNWYPQFISLKCTKSALGSCQYILVKDSNNNYSICSVEMTKISLDKTSSSFQETFSVLKNNEVRYFTYKDIKYIWVDEHEQFQELRDWDDSVKSIKDLEDSTGYTAEEQRVLLQIYGENKIEVKIPSYWQIFKSQLLQPFYVFQFFSVTLWLINDYISYAICVVALSLFSVIINLYTIKKERKCIRSLVHKSMPSSVRLVRKGGSVEEVDPSQLVPGDIIQIPKNGCIMPCDAVLLHGHCIVNEYILTGECCAVTKTPPVCSDTLFNSFILKRHVLFSGTEVVQTRYYGKKMVTAVTISTGFSTVKGELIRSLLHPKPLGFKFHEDSVKFVFCLFFVALCGIFYMGYTFFKLKMSVQTLVLDSLDLITIVVPPALPAALSAGVAYSRNRLLSKGIFCISPSKINAFGKLKLMCFDKTGTLTEEGLDLYGVLPCVQKQFTTLIGDPTILHPKDPLVIAMATCHCLTKIQGKICGSPLDLNMFQSLNWELNEPGADTSRYDLLCPTVVKPKFYECTGTPEWNDNCSTAQNKFDFSVIAPEILSEDLNPLPYEIGIVREFPFTSDNRCMSVITRQLGANHMNLYCKGAPEKIWELCTPDSLPVDFHEQLQRYTSMGFRVIGVAYKRFDRKFSWRKSQRVKRREIENELIFLGLIIMQNKLKPVSTDVMNELKKANIRCVMVTGDNLLTAVSVSRECLMVLPSEVVIEVKVTPPADCESAPVLSFQLVESPNEIGFSKATSNGTSSENSDYHYVLDGKTWELLNAHFNELIPKIIVKGTVFARMLPEQKTQLVEYFQDLDYVVGMCGDGANDYGAMKVAHVGVALSESETSVVAPFTSKIPDVSCIVSLVQEGRCALVSTFVIFKYMTVYSLIQFMSVLIIYEKGISFGNTEFLYVDLIVTSLLAVVMGRTGPSNTLVNTRPIARLISFGNLFPLSLQIVVLFLIQMSALEFLHEQKWFTAVSPGSEGVTICWENTVVYCVSLFQYVILALVYSKGKPYRRPFYTDVFFMVVFIALTSFSVLLCVWPFQSLAKIFEIMPVEEDSRGQTLFRFQLLIFPTLNLVLSFLIEAVTTYQKWMKNLIHFVSKKKSSKNRYKRILLSPLLHVLPINSLN